MLPIGVLILPYFVPLMVQTPLAVLPAPGKGIPPGGRGKAFAAAGSPRATAAEIPTIVCVSFRVSFMVAFLMTRITRKGSQGIRGAEVASAPCPARFD
jgi:hypothetical protein